MKTILIALSLLSLNAFAFDMEAAKKKAQEAAAKAADKGKEVYAACKKEQIEHCKAYFELAPLKECLIKNKEKLSPPCKKAVGI